MRSLHVPAALCVLLAAACDGAKPDEPKKADSARPGLVFEEVPESIRLNGRFRVRLILNDDAGEPLAGDNETRVAIAASGGGALRGTLTQTAVAGRVVFDDLSYDRWEPITLTVSAPGFPKPATTGTIPVRPVLRLATRPPQRFVVGEDAGKFEIELVDGLGHVVKSDNPVRLAYDAADMDVTGGPERPLAEGTATFDSIRFKTVGSKTLVWSSPGLSDVLHGVTVFDKQKERGLWLPAARVGLEYRTMLTPGGADFRLVRGSLPKGLSLEPTGELHGVPTSPQYGRFEVLSTKPGEPPWLARAELPVFPSVESSGAPLDDLDAAGPFEVASLDGSLEVRSRKTTEPMRTFFPARGGRVADGVFPLVVFHHGAGIVNEARPRLYDQYDHFLKRWASHGFVVVTVDATDLVWQEGRWVPGTLANLDAMAENLRAAVSRHVELNVDPAYPLHGHVDTTRVVLAGHSRGASAALIAARAEARVVGGVLIKPLDPANTVGGAAIWSGTLPAKPFLLVAAGDDGDLPYPMVDCLFERRAAPMLEVTILGSLHYYSSAEGGPMGRFDEGTTPSVTRREDWAVTNAYAVAFLRYAALGDMGAAERLFGGSALSSRLSTSGVLVQSDRRADALPIDGFQDDNPGRNLLDLPNRDRGMALSVDEPSLLSAVRTLPEAYRRMYSNFYQRADVLAASAAHRLEWKRGPAAYRLELGSLNVKGRAAFVMRARTTEGRLGGDQMRIAFADAAGRAVEVPSAGHVGAAAVGARFSDVVVPLADVGAAGLDLENLASVELVFDGFGSLLIDDLRFE